MRGRCFVVVVAVAGGARRCRSGRDSRSGGCAACRLEGGRRGRIVGFDGCVEVGTGTGRLRRVVGWRRVVERGWRGAGSALLRGWRVEGTAMVSWLDWHCSWESGVLGR